MGGTATGRKRRYVGEADAPWIAAAIEARTLLRATRQGERMSALTRLGGAHGASAGLLRRAVHSLGFLEELEERGIEPPPGLRGQNAQVVEIVARWHRRDPEGAFEAARAHLAGKTTFRELLADETASRTEPPRRRTLRTRMRGDRVLKRERLVADLVDRLGRTAEGIDGRRLAAIASLVLDHRVDPLKDGAFATRRGPGRPADA